MTINLTHRGIEMTPAIKQYVEEKMESLEKYDQQIRQVDVEIGLSSGRHMNGDIFVCKVSVHRTTGNVVRLEREEADLYKAIDKVRDHLRVELTEEKERKRDEHRGAKEEEIEEV